MENFLIWPNIQVEEITCTHAYVLPAVLLSIFARALAATDSHPLIFPDDKYFDGSISPRYRRVTLKDEYCL